MAHGIRCLGGINRKSDESSQRFAPKHTVSFSVWEVRRARDTRTDFTWTQRSPHTIIVAIIRTHHLSILPKGTRELPVTSAANPDWALLLALPALATLAAFALPTLQRSVAALIDWFTLAFFTSGGIIIWVIWFAMQTGMPRQAAINVFKQAPDFHATFALPTFLMRWPRYASAAARGSSNVPRSRRR